MKPVAVFVRVMVTCPQCGKEVPRLAWAELLPDGRVGEVPEPLEGPWECPNCREMARAAQNARLEKRHNARQWAKEQQDKFPKKPGGAA